MDGSEVSNIYTMNIQRGFEYSDLEVYHIVYMSLLEINNSYVMVYRKLKGKKSGVSQGGTIAFRGAYGELAILRSFFKKGNLTSFKL